MCAREPAADRRYGAVCQTRAPERAQRDLEARHALELDDRLADVPGRIGQSERVAGRLEEASFV
jgi:hypothetical protein